MAREPADADSVEESLIDRRSFLKATGFAVTSAAAVGATSTTAQAATVGYGGGGYGTVVFGGGAGTVPVTVTTRAVTNVQATATTLTGRVDDLGSANSVDVAFEYRTSEANIWTRTLSQTTAAIGTVTQTVTELQANTEYVFRIVATANGTTYVGETESFMTAKLDVSPSIDNFVISKSEQLGDDRMFTVKWSVSDPTADLDTVEVVTVNDLSSMNFAVTDVSGASASGWDLFQFPVGTTLDVTLRVTDGAGKVTKQMKTVTL